MSTLPPLAEAPVSVYPDGTVLATDTTAWVADTSTAVAGARWWYTGCLEPMSDAMLDVTIAYESERGVSGPVRALRLGRWAR